MEIKILGSGCPRCNELEKRTRNVLAEEGIAAEVIKIKDIKEFASYGVFATPAIVINGRVASSGRLPSEEEIKKYITDVST